MQHPCLTGADTLPGSGPRPGAPRRHPAGQRGVAVKTAERRRWYLHPPNAVNATSFCNNSDTVTCLPCSPGSRIASVFES
jgi:hypothetical protein